MWTFLHDYFSDENSNHTLERGTTYIKWNPNSWYQELEMYEIIRIHKFDDT